MDIYAQVENGVVKGIQVQQPVQPAAVKFS